MAAVTASPFALHAGTLPPERLRVLAFRGRESLSALFRWDVTVAAQSTDATSIEEELLGQPARLEIELGSAVRAVHGIVSRVSSGGAAVLDRRASTLRIAPRLSLLRHRTTTRIFQDKTAPEVVTAVLAEHGIAHRWELSARHPVHSYCTQYEESDLELVQRLLAESGIFYSFEPPETGAPVEATERVLLSDSAQYMPIEGDPRLLYRPSSGAGALSPEEHHIHAFSRAQRTAPGAYQRRDYDFLRPLLPRARWFSERSCGSPSRCPRRPASSRKRHARASSTTSTSRLD
jgi:type VI secretion system secreted protein VgrG